MFADDHQCRHGDALQLLAPVGPAHDRLLLAQEGVLADALGHGEDGVGDRLVFQMVGMEIDRQHEPRAKQGNRAHPADHVGYKKLRSAEQFYIQQRILSSELVQDEGEQAGQPHDDEAAHAEGAPAVSIDARQPIQGEPEPERRQDRPNGVEAYTEAGFAGVQRQRHAKDVGGQDVDGKTMPRLGQGQGVVIGVPALVYPGRRAGGPDLPALEYGPAVLTAVLARDVRGLTGFDRVLVHRFDTEWNGGVIAEARRTYPSPSA